MFISNLPLHMEIRRDISVSPNVEKHHKKMIISSNPYVDRFLPCRYARFKSCVS